MVTWKLEAAGVLVTITAVGAIGYGYAFNHGMEIGYEDGASDAAEICIDMFAPEQSEQRREVPWEYMPEQPRSGRVKF